MNFVKFRNVKKDMKDVYINIDSIVAVEMSVTYDNCTNIRTRSDSTFTVYGDLDSVMRMIFEDRGSFDRYEINSRNSISESCEKRCGLCKHYAIGSSSRQCRKHFEDRAEDDSPCHYYEP